VAAKRASKPTTVAGYIAASPKEIRPRLRELRALIAAAAPGATQSLKWGMPSFSYQRILVTYAAFKHHIGLFPTPATVREFKPHLTAYKSSSATIQFPHDQRLPKALIRRIVAFRVRQERSADAKWRSRSA
jgi:uncharacterized protein YdhG (YjbR/CyaY superfamily)